MELEQLRQIVADLRAKINAIVGKAQAVESLLYDVNTIIGPNSPAAPSLNIDAFLQSYAPLFEAAMMQLALASNEMLVSAYTPHVITVTHGPEGAVSPDGTVYILDLRSITFTITPNQGFVIADVVVDGVSVGRVTQYTFERVTSNHTLAVVFLPG